MEKSSELRFFFRAKVCKVSCESVSEQGWGQQQERALLAGCCPCPLTPPGCFWSLLSVVCCCSKQCGLQRHANQSVLGRGKLELMIPGSWSSGDALWAAVQVLARVCCVGCSSCPALLPGLGLPRSGVTLYPGAFSLLFTISSLSMQALELRRSLLVVPGCCAAFTFLFARTKYLTPKIKKREVYLAHH